MSSQTVEEKLVPLEEYLLSKEVTPRRGIRQKPKMNRLREFLDRSTIFTPIRLPTDDTGVSYIADPCTIRKELERLSCTGIERRKLRSLFKKWKYEELIIALCDRKVPLSRLLGDGRNFHFLSERARFLHLLGLAEAVSLAMNSLSIRVRFPNPIRICTTRERFLSVSLDSLIDENVSLVHKDGKSGLLLRRRRRKLIEKKLLEWSKEGTICNRPRYQNVWFRLTVHYLHQFPSGLPEKDYVKLIKLSLVHRFSLESEQELPEGDEVLKLFPGCTDFALKARFRHSRAERIQFFKHLLESKALCHPVSDDMVLEAYQKHFKSLCRPPEEIKQIPHGILQDLFQYGKKVGRSIKGHYDPYTTVLPNKRATITSSRKAGGSLSDLHGNMEIQKGPLSYSYQDLDSENRVRPEPVVIGLFGPPGSGKSTLVQNLIVEFSAYFGGKLSKKDLVYCRSCSSEHWDGYTQQPIVILDDFGQNLFERKDIVEFENIVSCNRYVLPMAHLENKGMEFSSQIIITTSNLVYGSLIRDASGSLVVTDELAVWRRFHLPFLLTGSGCFPLRKDRLLSGVSNPVEEFHHGSGTLSTSALHTPYFSENSKVFVDFWDTDSRSPKEVFLDTSRLLSSEKLKPSSSKRFLQAELFKFGIDRNSLYSNAAHNRIQTHIQTRQSPNCHHLWQLCERRSWKLGPECGLNFFPLIVKTIEERLQFHRRNHEGLWEQTIAEGTFSLHQAEPPFYGIHSREGPLSHDRNYHKTSLVFGSIPPYHRPKVDAVAICEPLKVRMITKAEKEVRCLKPLQKALFRYLRENPQFALTHGVSWSDERTFSERMEWIHRIESLIKGIWSRKGPDDKLLSGDYTSATDDFPMSVTNALLTGILSELDHEPTTRWALYEVSPHEIRYPTGDVGVQTSGQLMGSLLSFPLLCFLNDYLVSSSGFKPGSYLINGDDVVAAGSDESISNWKHRTPLVGLSLSLGKNYVDPEFCCVNSQLFFRGNVLHTGKASTMVRRGKSIGSCFSQVQFYYGVQKELKDNFIRKNLLLLRDTPQSLSIPTYLGGLGLFYKPYGPSDDKVDMKLAKEVYLTSFLKKIGRSSSVSTFDFVRLIHIPTGFLPDEEIQGLSSVQPDKMENLISSLEVDWSAEKESDTFDMRHSDLRHTRDILSDHPELWNRLQGRKLYDFPPLGCLTTRPILVGKDKVGWIKRKMISLALQGLLAEIDRREKDLSSPVGEAVFLEGPAMIIEEHYDLLSEMRERKEFSLESLPDAVVRDDLNDPFHHTPLDLSLDFLPPIEEEVSFRDQNWARDTHGNILFPRVSKSSLVQSSLYSEGLRLSDGKVLTAQEVDVEQDDSELTRTLPPPNDLEGSGLSSGQGVINNSCEFQSSTTVSVPLERTATPVSRIGDSIRGLRSAFGVVDHTSRQDLVGRVLPSRPEPDRSVDLQPSGRPRPSLWTRSDLEILDRLLPPLRPGARRSQLLSEEERGFVWLDNLSSSLCFYEDSSS